MAIVAKEVDIQVPDGTSMMGYLARPEGDGPHPGMLVFQEIFGVNPHIREVTERFAKAGFAALAPDLFHRTAPGFQSGYTDLDPGFQEMQKMTDGGVVADLKGAYDWLMTDPFADSERIGAVGFCMGGRVAFLANAVLPLQASVSYYGGGIAQTLLGHVADLHGPQLLLWAGRDPWISAEDTKTVSDALREKGKSFVSVEFSEAQHGFFCDARGSYNEGAANQAWALTQAFLATHLKER